MNKPIRILSINLMKTGPSQTENLELCGLQFEIYEHSIGWDINTALSLAASFDGKVDAIAVSGIMETAQAGKSKRINPLYLSLLRACVSTPMYLADHILNFFTEWTIHRIIKQDPSFFKGKRVLFHSALTSPMYKPVMGKGGIIQAADLHLALGIKKLIHTEAGLERLLKLTKLSSPQVENWIWKPKSDATIHEWIRASDIFVTYRALLEKMKDFSSMKGKIIFIDRLDAKTEQQLIEAGVADTIEIIPSSLTKSLLQGQTISVLNAMLDQARSSKNSLLSSEEFLLGWIQEMKLEPNRPKRKSKPKNKCAFIIHPLDNSQYFLDPRLKFIKEPSELLKKTIEYSASRMPAYYHDTIYGIKSQATGEEVECDLFVLPATPAQLLSMNEEFVYARLIEATKQAYARGAQIIGLGAYTKVIGDNGVSVAHGSPIPVTTGNSFSSSTTLWAAREMVEKLDLASHDRVGTRLKAKAIVFGATGSIGRVSSLLLSLVFQELILISTSPEKLIELKREILEFSPETQIRIMTSCKDEVADADLIVTATSNRGGKLLDIQRVKPGAVICDCSRPFDFSKEDAEKRPDLIIINSGEVLLPGNPTYKHNIGLPKPYVYACLAETAILAMEERYECFSLSRELSMNKVKEIYKLGRKHGASLAKIRGPLGIIDEAQIDQCRELAKERLKTWEIKKTNRNETGSLSQEPHSPLHAEIRLTDLSH